ncbi:uncharacterized protein EDB93DRAFT_1166600, partial [Suillus bovinus]|uniref:uncharacterized protein n=1 Tax=Suillus bovinus TaxID=48563 RepID=UPI001B875EC2
ALELLIIVLNWTLFSAVITGLVWFNASPLDPPQAVNVDILMRQHTLTLRHPPFGPRCLPKHKVERLRAIPASMPAWFMKLLNSLQFIFPLIQFVVTMVLLVIVWFF